MICCFKHLYSKKIYIYTFVIFFYYSKMKGKVFNKVVHFRIVAKLIKYLTFYFWILEKKECSHIVYRFLFKILFCLLNPTKGNEENLFTTNIILNKVFKFIILTEGKEDFWAIVDGSTNSVITFMNQNKKNVKNCGIVINVCISECKQNAKICRPLQFFAKT